ncbi:ATP-binding protein [Roseateles sp.]|uniref:ATP-binding protein n=1 Tax=Roseateles sp. TaxID=1971397 RepID=UPI003BAB5954
MTDLNPATRVADASADEAGFALRCGDIEIDRATRRLRRQGQALTLGSRAIDLLLALIDGRAQVQTADALRAAVWPDRAVGDNNLRVQMTHLRRLLGEHAILYRSGRGYQLLAAVHDVAPQQAAPDLRPGNLPEALWPVLGRDGLLAELALRLRPGERPTLAGPGGAGKTALALAAAAHAAAAFADGTWWVDLAALRDSSQLPHAVASALQRPLARENAMEHLANGLAGQCLLLVLDNCEHLLAAAAALSDRLLHTAPTVALLATSRLPLRSAGERVIGVPPLSLPLEGDTDAESARASGAVAVFEARARAGDPRFRVTPTNAGTVVEVCRRLDGHALAITLAAALVPVLGLNAVRDGLAERLRWMQRAAPGSAAPQHLSLQGTLDWSYELLNPAEQRLLRCLGVFTGRFSLDAVAAVAGTDAAALARPLESLMVHGLVSIDSAGLLGTDEAVALHTMHESARLYAHQCLVSAGEADAARGALGRHLVTRLHQPLAHRSATPTHATKTLMRLLPDAQALVEWATVADPPLAAHLCSRGADLWRQVGQHALVRRLAAPLLARPVTEAERGLRIELLLSLCLVDFELEDRNAVLVGAAEVLTLVGAADEVADPARLTQRGMALAWQANLHATSRQPALSEALYEESLALFRRAGNARRVREMLSNLGWVLQAQGKFDAARQVLNEALDLAVADGDDWGQMVCHENLGELELALRSHAAAAAHFEREAVLARRRPDMFRLAYAQAYLGLACAGSGDGARALAALHEALQIATRHGFARMQVEACSALAVAFMGLGEPAKGYAALCAARRWRARHGAATNELFDALERDVEQRARHDLSDADCRRAQAQGELLTPDEATAWAAEGGGTAPPLKPPARSPAAAPSST